MTLRLRLLAWAIRQLVGRHRWQPSVYQVRCSLTHRLMHRTPLGSLPIGARFRTLLTGRAGIVYAHNVRSFADVDSLEDGTAVRLDRCGKAWVQPRILDPRVVVLPEVA